MFAHFLLDFSQRKVRFAQVLAFSKVAKTEGKVFVALWAYQGDFEPSRATISPQSRCSLIPVMYIHMYVRTHTHSIQKDVHSYACTHIRKTEKNYMPRHHPMRGHKTKLTMGYNSRSIRSSTHPNQSILQISRL